jgi:hypothetical protein
VLAFVLWTVKCVTNHLASFNINEYLLRVAVELVEEYEELLSPQSSGDLRRVCAAICRHLDGESIDFEMALRIQHEDLRQVALDPDFDEDHPDYPSALRATGKWIGRNAADCLEHVVDCLLMRLAMDDSGIGCDVDFAAAVVGNAARLPEGLKRAIEILEAECRQSIDVDVFSSLLDVGCDFLVALDVATRLTESTLAHSEESVRLRHERSASVRLTLRRWSTAGWEIFFST